LSSRAPDYAEPIVAWRVWRVLGRREDLRLRSVVYGTLWPVGEPMRARCLRHRRSLLPWRRPQEHVAPEEACTCGVYAADLDGLRPYLDGFEPRLRPVQRVLGRVSLWGEVLECERGWRATLGYPQRLYVPTSDAREEDAREVAQALGHYGVPVELLECSGSDDALRLLAPHGRSAAA
jgi:hypothetical protein